MFGAGFNHFWHAESENHGGDCLYIQGHVSPGVYARAYLEGRLTEEQLLNFRQEVDGKGLSSYPHPKLMPEFWQFPTVSMGLGPLMAIYQARFLKYLHARGIANTENRKVWVFCGDGEMDEVESLGAIGLAAREKLDNLIFVVNCNLQRLDGPVRGNGKIVQELEGEFRGSGWNVIKLLWGSEWDPLLARDKDGALKKLMMETLDGDYQSFKANDGAYVRKHFFGRDPRTLEMVAHMSDDEIWALKRGGHDPKKVYAAYHSAVNHKDQPTVLLIKTVKGYGMGKSGEGKNNVHQTKKLTDEDIKIFRDRFNIPVPDSQIADIPFYKPADDTPEMKYLHERRKALGGYLPHRRVKADEQFTVPSLETFKTVIEPTRSCTTAKTKRARFCKRASTRPAACAAGLLRPPATARTTASWCRSTCTTRCLASSALVTWPGQLATCRPAASCWAAPPGAQRSTAKACSMRTATATFWPERSPTASLMTRRLRTKWA
jgi:pyruvate dehydrogenase E1 component